MTYADWHNFVTLEHTLGLSQATYRRRGILRHISDDRRLNPGVSWVLSAAGSSHMIGTCRHQRTEVTGAAGPLLVAETAVGELGPARAMQTQPT